MLAVLTVALLGSQIIYDDTSKWSWVLSGRDFAESRIGVLVSDEYKTVFVSCRGSTTPHDFLKDAAAGLLLPEGKLGCVAWGFYDGMPEVYAKIISMIPPGYRLVFTGHSLGASQASILAGYAVAQGVIPAACVLMGSPRPGRSDLCALLRQIPIWYSFQNGLDPVCDVPPFANHSHTLIPLHEIRTPADTFDHWGLLVDWHHWQLYLRGIAKLALPPLIADAPAVAVAA